MAKLTRFVLAATLIVVSCGSAVGGQTPARGLMRQKLGLAQSILGAVVTSDWEVLARDARALEALTHDPAWEALVTPTSRHRTDMFQLALKDLVGAADKQNLDDAVMAQVAVNLNCVRCHQLLGRNARQRGGVAQE